MAARLLSRPDVSHLELAINYTPCGIELYKDRIDCHETLVKIFDKYGKAMNKTMTVYGTCQDNEPFTHTLRKEAMTFGKRESAFSFPNNTTTVASMSRTPDLIEFLRPPLRPDGRRAPTAWEVWATEIDEESSALLIFGINEDVGFLRWHSNRRAEAEVPAITRLINSVSHYHHSGVPYFCNTGEEIPIEYIYAAVAQFVATGARPGCLQWVEEASIPDDRPNQQYEGIEEIDDSQKDRPRF